MVNLSFDAGRTTSRRQGKKKKRLTPKGLDGRNRLVRLEESTIKAKRKRGPNEEALAIYDLNPPPNVTAVPAKPLPREWFPWQGSGGLEPRRSRWASTIRSSPDKRRYGPLNVRFKE